MDLKSLTNLYGVVIEKLRQRGGVADEGKHFTWEPTQTETGTPYQHIRFGPYGIADTYHSDLIEGVPGTIFFGDCPAKPGDKQIADLIVGLLQWFPDAIQLAEEVEQLRSMIPPPTPPPNQWCKSPTDPHPFDIVTGNCRIDREIARDRGLYPRPWWWRLRRHKCCWTPWRRQVLPFGAEWVVPMQERNCTITTCNRKEERPR